MSIEITPEEVKTATRIADNLVFRHPGIVERDELVSHMTIWMLQHENLIRRIRGEGRGLYTTLRREAVRFMVTERAYQRGYEPEDQFRYPPGLLHELLEQALPLERDLSSSGKGQHQPSGNKPDPAFGGDRLVMLIDVRQALEQLSPLLAARIKEAVDWGYDYHGLAERWSTEEKPVTAKAARERVEYAIRKLSDILSEPRAERWQEYTGSRKAVPNARAQGAIAVGANTPTAERSPWLEGGILS
jgi:hypothetical protein